LRARFSPSPRRQPRYGKRVHRDVCDFVLALGASLRQSEYADGPDRESV
jgi:hypothetical protein